jgi:hypothetical protein
VAYELAQAVAGCLLAWPEPDARQAAPTAARPTIGGVDVGPASLPPWNELSHLTTRPGRYRVGKESGHRARVTASGVEG